MARSHGGARQGVEGVPPSVRPTRTKLDYDHSNITYQMFSSAADGVMNTVSVFRWRSGTGKEKMDPDKSVVFVYDGVPAHLDLAIPAPYVHSLCFSPGHRWKGFKLSESDTKSRYLKSGNLKMYRMSQKFVPLISCTITFAQNFIFTWNFLKMYISLSSICIQNFSDWHALFVFFFFTTFCIRSRYVMKRTSVSGGQLKYGDQFFFVTAWYKKIMRKQKWLLPGNFCARRVPHRAS